MARSGGGGYNLTVQLNLQGPSNVNQVVNNINRQLGNIQANVNLNLPANVTRQLANINRQMQQTSRAANQATTAMESFGRAAGLAVRRFGAFTAATAGFYAITRATRQSLEKFIEFDRQITRIAQVANTTKQSLSGLSSEITKLAVSFGASSSDLAAVSVTLSQAGLSARETEKALKALALTTLAPTFSDINQTVEGSIALMKQFSISTNQLEKALGSINAVAGSFAVEAGDLITAVQRAGGVFAAASQGVSTGTDALNEFLAVFTSVRATTRESAETIATGLRTIFTRLQREDTIAALQAFGVQLTDLEGKFIGPYKAVEQLAKGLGRLDPRSLEFSGIVEELGGFRQVGKVIPLIQRFATAQQALNVAQQGSGSLAKDAAVGQQSLAVQISKVKEEFNALIRSIGETDEFKQFIRLSLDLASALIKVADAIKPVLPAVAALGAIRIAGGIGSFARGFRGGLGFNSGGLVPGTGNSDSVRASLTPGEYVIRKKAVQAIGVSNLERMNKYASGGKVKDYIESAPYAQDVKDVPSWNKKPGEPFRTSGSRANRFNPEDYFQYQKNTKNINVNRLSSAKSEKARENYYRAARQGDYRNRGIAFEQVLYAAGIVKSLAGRRKGITSGSPRLDAFDNTGVAEIKSTRAPIDEANINAKMIGSALNPIGNTDRVIRSRFTKNAKLDERVNTFNLGNLTVYQDTTPIKLTSGKTQKLGRTKKAVGGPISGQDTVPALLTPGEYVINARAASAIGEQRLNALNNADRIGYNRGGRVRLNNGRSPVPSSNAIASQALGQSPRQQQSGMPGGSFTFLFSLQAAASGLTAAMGETSASAMATSKAIQGLATSASVGILAFEAFRSIPGVGGKAAGAIGLVAGGFMALDSIIKAVANSTREFDRKMAQTKLGTSLDSASSAMERFAKNTNDTAARLLAIESLSQAGEAAKIIAETETGKPMSLRQYYVERNLEEYGLDSEYGSEAMDNAAARLRAQSTFGGFTEYFNREGFNQQVIQEAERARIAASQQFAQVREPMMKMAEIEVSRGASIDQVFAGLDAEQRRTIAMANVDVARRLEGVQGPERENIINQEVMRQLNAGLGQAVADRTANVANQAAQQLQVALERVFESMKQNFAAVASDIDSRFGRVADSLSVSLGQTNIGYNNKGIKSVLDNPKAFSDAQVKDAIQSTMPLLGNKGGRIGQFALVSTRMEEQIGNIIDNTLMDPNVAEGYKLGSIGGQLKSLVSGLNLGSDVEVVISKQLDEAFDAAKKQLAPGASPTEIRQRVQEIVENLPGLNGALDVVRQAMETFASAQQKYSQVVQQVTEAVLKQREYLNRASSIRRESRIELKKTLGEEISLNEIIGNVMATVANQTGGLTNVRALADQQRFLMEERNRVAARRDAISGRADTNPEFVSLTQRLAELDIQLQQNRSGLEMLASSSQIASAALSEYSRIVQQGQAKMAFAEQVATATPQQYQEMKDNFNQLQNIITGGAVPNLYSSRAAQDAMMKTYAEGGNIFQMREAGETALSQQRSGMLSLMKELKPFFGDNNRGFNEAYEKVLRSFLSSTGRMNPVFEQMFQEMRGQTDRQQTALQVYERATQIQVQANQALANMIDPMSALAEANDNLAKAIDALAARMNNVPGFANGGPVYASSGKLVNMKPKGTDTIPAMLTPGEFVINAKATKKHRRLLERINGGGSPDMLGGTAYAQDGGFMERAQLKYQTYYRMYKEMHGGMPMPLAMRGQMKMRAMQEAQLEWMMEQQGGQQQQGININGLRESLRRDIVANNPNISQEELARQTSNRRNLYQHQQAKRRQYYEYQKTYKAARARGENIQGPMADINSFMANSETYIEKLGDLYQDPDQRRQDRTERLHQSRVKASRKRAEAADRDKKYLYRHRDTATGQLRSVRGEVLGIDNQGRLMIEQVDSDGKTTGEIANIPLTELPFNYRKKAQEKIAAINLERGIGAGVSLIGQGMQSGQQMISGVGDFARQAYNDWQDRVEEKRQNLERWNQAATQGAETALGMAVQGLGAVREAAPSVMGAVGSGIWNILEGTRPHPSASRTRSRFPSFPNDGNIPRKPQEFIPPPETPGERLLREIREEQRLASIEGPSIGAAPTGPVRTRFGTVSQAELESLARQPGETEGQHQRRLMEWKAAHTGPSMEPGLDAPFYPNLRAGIDMLGTFGAGIVTTGTPMTGIGSRRAQQPTKPSAGRGYGVSTSTTRRQTRTFSPGAPGTFEISVGQPLTPAITRRQTRTFGPGAPGTFQITTPQVGRPQVGGQAPRLNNRIRQNLATTRYLEMRNQGMTHDESMMHLSSQGYGDISKRGEYQLLENYALSGLGKVGRIRTTTDPSSTPAVRPQGQQTQAEPYNQFSLPSLLSRMRSGDQGETPRVRYNRGRSFYDYENRPMTIMELENLERQMSPYARGHMRGVSLFGSPYTMNNPRLFRNIGETPAAKRASISAFSNGGIVSPAYLSNGGGAWQFEDISSGYFDYNALNTDYANVGGAYSTVGKYASPREKSYMRIKASGDSGFASQRGFGYDAAGRPVFESRYGYSDPRSDERDFQTIFGYNRYPSFLASGGLAKGTDKYPAMLSRGEMVMNAEATRKNEGILRAMNKSSGGIVNNGILYAANGTDGPIGMSGGGGGFGGGAVLGGAFELSQSINSFMSVSDFIAGSFNNLSNSLSLFTQMDFGVLNEGATMMQTASSIFRTAASSLNTPLSGFGQSVQSFVSQTSNLISAIARIGDVNGTINVTGRIDIPPIQVNVVGAEIVQTIVPDIESRIMSSIATSLANDNPGMNVSSLSVSGPY